MGEALTVSQMESILLEDEHIVAIHHSEKWELPEIDHSIFGPNNRESRNVNIGALEEYLNSPCIEDNFNYHGDRRNWRDQMKANYHWFTDIYSNNALRVNRISVAISVFQVINLYYSGTMPDELAELTRPIYNILKEPYDSKTAQEKIEHIKYFKNLIYNAVVFLSQQSPASSQ